MPLITDESYQILMKIIISTLVSLMVSLGFCILMTNIWLTIGWMYYADVRSLGMVVAFFLLTQIVYVLNKGTKLLHKRKSPLKPALIVLLASIVATIVLVAFAAWVLGSWLAIGTVPPTD